VDHFVRRAVGRGVRLLMGKALRKRPARLAGKLLEIRRKLGLSQNEMIRHLGLGDELQQDYVSKFERGVLVPPLHILLAYAEAANVWVEVLIKDSLDLPDELPSRSKYEGVERAVSSSRKRGR
jgi:transcriptional regulator with XRE-family HTH domain